MKILTYISILALFLIFTSFHTTESQTSDYLIQKWVYEDYDSGKLIYKSNRKFIDDRPGIEFKENGELIRRQNSGWCGTPPIDYELASGTWIYISDSILVIEYKNWSGLIKDTMQIIELSKSKLTLKSIYTLKKT